MPPYPTAFVRMQNGLERQIEKDPRLAPSRGINDNVASEARVVIPEPKASFWPLAVIAIAGLLSIAWGGLLAYGA